MSEFERVASEAEAAYLRRVQAMGAPVSEFEQAARNLEELIGASGTILDPEYLRKEIPALLRRAVKLETLVASYTYTASLAS